LLVYISFMCFFIVEIKKYKTSQTQIQTWLICQRNFSSKFFIPLSLSLSVLYVYFCVQNTVENNTFGTTLRNSWLTRRRKVNTSQNSCCPMSNALLLRHVNPSFFESILFGDGGDYIHTHTPSLYLICEPVRTKV